MFQILPAGSPEVADTRLPAFVVAHDGLYLRKQSLLGLSQTKVDRVDYLPAETEFVEAGRRETAIGMTAAPWQNRIVGHDDVPPANLTPNPGTRGAIPQHISERFPVPCPRSAGSTRSS